MDYDNVLYQINGKRFSIRDYNYYNKIKENLQSSNTYSSEIETTKAVIVLCYINYRQFILDAHDEMIMNRAYHIALKNKQLFTHDTDEYSCLIDDGIVQEGHEVHPNRESNKYNNLVFRFITPKRSIDYVPPTSIHPKMNDRYSDAKAEDVSCRFFMENSVFPTKVDIEKYIVLDQYSYDMLKLMYYNMDQPEYIKNQFKLFPDVLKAEACFNSLIKVANILSGNVVFTLGTKFYMEDVLDGMQFPCGFVWRR